MPKVFISHSWEDSDIARKIAEYIKRDGANVWIDYDRITGGESLPDRISEALEWCDTLVLVWSQSVASSYYVKLEWQSALDLKKRIIQCLIDDARRPAILRGFLYIDFQNFNQGYKELCRALGLKMVEIATPKPRSAKKNKTETPTIESPKEIAPTKKDLFFQPEKTASITRLFRSTPKELSVADVKTMLKKYDFYCKEGDWNKDYSNPNGHGFVNQLELKTIQSDNVVMDHASGLMWQQSGSSEKMTFEAAKKWITDFNQQSYAGYHDWRLPTLEEAMSLIQPKGRNRDLHVDPKFDANQRRIWTSDQVYGESWAWVAGFGGGSCYDHYFDDDTHYLRAVRSRQSDRSD